MNCDLLLEWMTHMGSGAWLAFRQTVAEIYGEDDDAYRRSHLRSALSDLGHASFFVENSTRWRVLRPAVVEIPTSNEFLLAGGRTRILVDKLHAAAARSGIRASLGSEYPTLSRIGLVGERESVKVLASEVGLDYVPDIVDRIAARLTPIRATLAAAEKVPEPINWSVRSWSFDRADWVPGRTANTTREYSNRHGMRRYLLHCGDSELVSIQKRESLYAAALLAGIKIIRYFPSDHTLHVPRWAPLPAPYARLASLASGRLSVAAGGETVFQNIDLRVATLLSVGLGQGFPEPVDNLP
jgi:hypothetical protein